jgi:hypothetical protein
MPFQSQNKTRSEIETLKLSSVGGLQEPQIAPQMSQNERLPHVGRRFVGVLEPTRSLSTGQSVTQRRAPTY